MWPRKWAIRIAKALFFLYLHAWADFNGILGCRLHLSKYSPVPSPPHARAWASSQTVMGKSATHPCQEAVDTHFPDWSYELVSQAVGVNPLACVGCGNILASRWRPVTIAQTGGEGHVDMCWQGHKPMDGC